MKLETHLAVGLAIGAGLSYRLPLLQTALLSASAVVGALTPDVPIAAQVKVDDWKGRPRFSTELEGNIWFTLKEISHSPLIWAVGFLALLLPMQHINKMMVFAFTLGVLSHWVIDVFTHCGPEFHDTDQSLLFPFYHLFPSIPKLGYYLGTKGWGWEYSHNYKEQYEDLGKTKKPERVFQLLMLTICIVILTR